MYRLCRALVAFVYFDFTRRCFCLCLDRRLLGRLDDEDDELELDVESWLMDGGFSSSSPSAEDCSSQRWAWDCSLHL